MRTYEQIVKQMFDEHCKSAEGWPDNLSAAQVYNDAAKEYAKQWVAISVAIAGIDRTIERNGLIIRMIEAKIDTQ